MVQKVGRTEGKAKEEERNPSKVGKNCKRRPKTWTSEKQRRPGKNRSPRTKKSMGIRF